MSIKIYIVDDEQENVNQIKQNLEYLYGDVHNVESETKSQEALEFLKENKIDLLFLKIGMKEMGGFKFLKSANYNAKTFQVVFLAHTDEYALKAFRIDAMDYILKPIAIKDLERVMGKILKYKQREQYREYLGMRNN